MKKRIISFLLLIVIAFSLLTPAFSYSQEIYIIEDYANVIDFEALIELPVANFRITDNYSEQLITIVTFKNWDGDFSSKAVSDAMKELHIKNPETSIGMTIIFDIEQGNYGIKIGGGVKAMFDDDDADRYMENYFRKYYETGNYTLAVTNLSKELYRWYEQNYAKIPPPSYPWYVSPLFIIFAVILFLALMYILYGIFARLAYLKHCFDAYYIEQNLPIPAFGFRQIRSAPFYCSDERTFWNFAGEIWKENHPFLNCFEPLEVKRNAFDIIAVILKLIVLAFIWIIILLIVVFASRNGDAHSSNSSYDSSDSGGGGHGSGGGGGHR